MTARPDAELVTTVRRGWRWKRAIRLTRRVVLFLHCAPWTDGNGAILRSTGVALAVPWRGLWFRPHLIVIVGLDDGCAKLTLEAVTYWAIRQKAGPKSPKKERVYVANTKRYVRIMLRARYRGRKFQRSEQEVA